MACSKELRIPKPWLNYHDDIENESIDPELFSQDELITWLKDLELCREKSIVENLISNVRPYHAVRHQFVRFSSNALNKELFSLWANAIAAVYTSDDVLELVSEDEMRLICVAYQSLDEHICDHFPEFPTIIEMKAFLLQKNVQEKFIPHIICLHDFSNKIAKSLLKNKKFPDEDVKEFWRRLVVVDGSYLEGLWSEVKHITGLYAENVWTRLCASGILLWAVGQEVMSGTLVEASKHLTLLTELYYLESFFCMVVNDIYSYKREMKINARICNMVKTIAVGKNCEESEAVQKCIEIINAVVKIMYQKIENTKQENPEDKNLWRLLDNIGLSTAVGIEGGELEEWQQAIDEEPPNEVMPLLHKCSSQARKFSEAIVSGDLNMGAILKLSG